MAKERINIKELSIEDKIEHLNNVMKQQSEVNKKIIGSLGNLNTIIKIQNEQINNLGEITKILVRSSEEISK